jgi:Protein of unknown function/Domain of unknown function (DUF1835)
MIHVMFSASAAGTLRQLLGDRAIRQRVIDLHSDLDFGPIGSGETQERTDWFNRTIPNDFGGWTWFDEALHRFNKVAADPDRLVWIAPKSAAEQCGFYWYLSRFGGSGSRMIIADFGLQHSWEGEVPRSLGSLGVEPMGELLDECSRVDWDPARFPQDRWPALMAENALLRVVIDGQVQSVAEDLFDHFLLAACPPSWTKHYRVIGEAMGHHIWKAGHNVGDHFLHWRLRELVAQGMIATESDLPNWGTGSAAAIRIRRI